MGHNLIDVETVLLSSAMSLGELYFVKQVEEFKREIPYNRVTVDKQLEEILDYYGTLATSTGVTVDYLESKENILRVLSREFDRRALLFLCDNIGNLVLDEPERLIIFYHYYKSVGNEKQIKTAEALCYVLLAKIIKTEVAVLNEEAGRRNINATRMVNNLKNFGWRKCPLIFRGYMTILGIYDHPRDGTYRYKIEAHKYGYLGFLMSVMGYSKEEALTLLRTQKQGLFYTFLPIEVEARLLEHILSSTSTLTRMPQIFNGKGVKALLSYEAMLIESNTFSETDNVYLRIIRQSKINALGTYIGELSKRAKENGVQGIDVYALSDGHVAFTSPTKLENYAPTLVNKAMEVNYFPFDLDGLFI